MQPGLTVAPLVAPLVAAVDRGRLRVLRPALRAGRLGINMATRKRHTPEQVVRKLATADLGVAVVTHDDPGGACANLGK